MARPSPVTNGIAMELRPSEIAEALQVLIKAKKSVMLHGSPGIGKSQMVQQAADVVFAEEYGYRVAWDYTLEKAVNNSTKFRKLESEWEPVPATFNRPWFVDFRTALHDSVDLTGLPHIEGKKTEWAIPALLPTDPRGGV